MISKSDWNAVNEELAAEERRKLGDPPTVEEVLAYSRGELPPAEEERVRELLVCHPALARIMFASAPEHEAKPGEAGYVSDEELARRLAALEERLQLPAAAAPVRRAQRGRVFGWRYAPIAAAAVLVIVSGLYIDALLDVRRLSRELHAPRVAADERLIVSDHRRGVGPLAVTLDPDASSYTIVVPADGNYRNFRLEILDYETQRSVWKSDLLRRHEDDRTFSIFFGREFLPPGDYQVVVYGVAGEREEKLDTHSFIIRGRGAFAR